MSKYIQMYDSDVKIPWVDVDNVENITKEDMQRSQFSETTFKNVVQRNIERILVPKSASLISVAGQCVETKTLDDISVHITDQPTGGVSVEFPVNPNSGDSALITSVADKKPSIHQMERADISYNVKPEAKIVGNSASIHEEYRTDASEQLAAKMDNLFIEGLDDSYLSTNTVNLTNAWDTDDGDPDEDIGNAITQLMKVSGINPNRFGSVDTPRWSLIVPVGAYASFIKTKVIDNHIINYGDYLRNKHGLQILFSRPPFNFDGTWELGNNAYLIPTNDRKVGRFYMFNGRRDVPSMYRDVTPKGEHITLQYWLTYIAAASERTGNTGNTNERIYKLGGIIS